MQSGFCEGFCLRQAVCSAPCTRYILPFDGNRRLTISHRTPRDTIHYTAKPEFLCRSSRSRHRMTLHGDLPWLRWRRYEDLCIVNRRGMERNYSAPERADQATLRTTMTVLRTFLQRAKRPTCGRRKKFPPTTTRYASVCAGVAGYSAEARRAEFAALLRQEFSADRYRLEPDYVWLTGALHGEPGMSSRGRHRRGCLWPKRSWRDVHSRWTRVSAW